MFCHLAVIVVMYFCCKYLENAKIVLWPKLLVQVVLLCQVCKEDNFLFAGDESALLFSLS